MQYIYCYNCGHEASYNKVFPIDADLKSTWQISAGLEKLFNIREGHICRSCGANKRAQGLAYGILKSKFGYGQKTLIDWVKLANKKKLAVCELNSCHKLHDTLLNLENLTYSEYGTETEQNIEQLTYKPDQFDLVLHSETLEHVSNPRLAMEECRRILKPTGQVVFTIPVIWNRKTRQRASLNNNKITTLLSKSYHGYQVDDYLVFFEYGRNVDSILGSNVLTYNWKSQNYVFSSNKTPLKVKLRDKIKFRLLESIATK